MGRTGVAGRSRADLADGKGFAGGGGGRRRWRGWRQGSEGVGEDGGAWASHGAVVRTVARPKTPTAADRVTVVVNDVVRGQAAEAAAKREMMHA
jgi:hypothetical protein